MVASFRRAGGIPSRCEETAISTKRRRFGTGDENVRVGVTRRVGLSREIDPARRFQRRSAAF
jgi:hypothetical protein